MLDKLIRFCLKNKLVVVLATAFIVLWGIMVAPFDWEFEWLPRDPVPVDAIPDIGENQQIVFTEWMGRSPQDVEDQITYPLTVSLLGVPGIKTVRSYSFFGFSSIYIIFKEGVDFYWSRSRVLEKLNSLPAGTLPEGVQPALGPDATALGQIFWYTLEGYDEEGNPTGGWDLHELRTIQDWTVRYALLSADGVSEVASVGGYVQEYQIDVDPDAMRAFGVTLEEVFNAVRMSNVDVGARTIEINRVEYVIRGLGFIKDLKDIEKSVIKVNENIPIYIKDVAHVTLGPALRRGALDKEGAEAVGGVVVVRYGENPLAAIKNVKKKIAEISAGLPKKTLADGTVSQVRIVPFYDRTGLIYETLGTLNRALEEEVLITIIVVLILLMHFRSSVLVSGLLPLAILMTFIVMKVASVDANIVALTGIAIAIGTLVDMGIIVCENILKHLQDASPDENKLEVVFRATREVGSAVLTAISTTIIAFLPIFSMSGAEGKLFKPLAFTTVFALLSAITIALVVIPPLAHSFFTAKPRFFGLASLGRRFLPEKLKGKTAYYGNILAVLLVSILLTRSWLPIGPEKGFIRNFLFVVLCVAPLLTFFYYFQKIYSGLLRRCLKHKLIFLIIPLFFLLFGFTVWFGFDRVFSLMPQFVKNHGEKILPGLGKEFMPPLDEGSYLYMPTTMPHASIGESMDALQKQDLAIRSIPEIDSVVGKIGRVESPLDPAPISMVETVVNYKPEFITDEQGHRIRFRYDRRKGEFVRDEFGNLIPDKWGRPYRQWRDTIHSPDDIWDEIVRTAQVPGSTSAPKLQPIAARIVMLQSGMRAPMGVKVKGPDLQTVEKVGFEIEKFLKEVPSVNPDTVLADRIVGKPYLEIDIDREAIARYGIHLRKVQDVIEIAIGGRRITTTVEGRERFPVRVRYLRELRDDIESLGKILVPAADGAQIPLIQLAEIRYVRGPQVIKSEDTFLTGYVIFDMKPGYAEVDVVEQCQKVLQDKIKSGELELPAGVSYSFAGSYENQVRSEKKLRVILPLALFIIFLILYFQFKKVPVTLLVFSGILVAWAGGFILIWLYAQDWFLNFSLFGVEMRNVFQINPINLSVAVWVGFLALFGIASDNGVVITTYLNQSFEKARPDSVEEIHEAVIKGAQRRIRPCLMTTGTTILALIPVLTSTGRGADIMVPMAIPTFGGMCMVLVTVFIVPVLYSIIQERQFYKRLSKSA